MYHLWQAVTLFLNRRVICRTAGAGLRTQSSWPGRAYVSRELMGLVPAVFSAYGELCANMRCPSFDKCDIYFCKVTDSTKLEQITNQFWRTAGKLCPIFFLIGSSASGNDIFALKMTNMAFWNWTFYIEWTLCWITESLCSSNDLPVSLSSRLTARLLAWTLSVEPQFYLHGGKDIWSTFEVHFW